MNKSFSQKISALSMAVLFVVSGCGSSGTVANIDKFGSNDKFYSVYYGTLGGNIRPVSISIDDKGIVTGDDEKSQNCIKKNLKLTNEQLQSIVDKAVNNNFFNLPDEIGAPALRSDSASRFILLTTSASIKKVLERPGGKDASFETLFSYINGLATQDGCGL